jgi:hypothetical protein
MYENVCQKNFYLPFEIANLHLNNKFIRNMWLFTRWNNKNSISFFFTLIYNTLNWQRVVFHDGFLEDRIMLSWQPHTRSYIFKISILSLSVTLRVARDLNIKYWAYIQCSVIEVWFLIAILKSWHHPTHM